MTTLSVSTTRVDSQLEANLELGNEIDAHVQETVPIILNYLERRDIDYIAEGKKAGFPLSMVNFQMIASQIFEMAYTPVATANFTTKNIQKIAAVAKKVGIGTCLEMSAVALDYCVQKKTSQNAELFYLEGGNHVFLVLGRDKMSQPSDLKRWGAHAVICDTWSGKVFPASEIESKLKNFVQNKTIKDRVITVLEPFNPKRHTPTLLRDFS